MYAKKEIFGGVEMLFCKQNMRVCLVCVEELFR